MIEWIEALIYFTLAVFGWITGSFIYGFIHHEWTYNNLVRMEKHGMVTGLKDEGRKYWKVLKPLKKVSSK